MRNKKKFNEFMNKTIEELKDEKRYGTAHVYQSTLNAFCEFCGCKIVYFHQLNRATLKEFETHLRDKQLSWNTVSTYMRTLRGAYNKAVDQKITTGNSRLFNHVYTGVKNDVKRALEVEEINKLLNEVPLKRLPEDLVRCRVWANLMFQLRGMPFVDLAFLHKSDLKGNTLSYRRHKTGGPNDSGYSANSNGTDQTISEYRLQLSLSFPYPERHQNRRRAVYRVSAGATDHEL